MDNNLKFKIFKLFSKINTFKVYQSFLYIFNIVIFVILYSLFENSSMLILAIITAIILNCIFIVQKADGILLIKILNTDRISMEYCNYEHYTDRDMFNMFEKSINLIFNSDYIEKLKVKKIYIRTHSALANFIIKKLHQKNNIPYSKKLFKECYIIQSE